MEQRRDHKTRFKPQYGDKPMARKPVSVLLPSEIDEFVRSLPNKSEWLRQAIEEKYEQDVASDQDRELA